MCLSPLLAPMYAIAIAYALNIAVASYTAK